ncbi:MAG: hypothetical protein P4L43_02810 [Syntrophobacteraceae bacterium]|nr:hypothetical protein [Syntrophobacteraceae bacterium]
MAKRRRGRLQFTSPKARYGVIKIRVSGYRVAAASILSLLAHAHGRNPRQARRTAHPSPASQIFAPLPFRAPLDRVRSQLNFSAATITPEERLLLTVPYNHDK